MPFINFEGQVYRVPGVYTSTKVVSSLTGPLPAFHIPVILGHAVQGTPYDVDSKLVTGESAIGPLRLCRTESAVAELFGRESDVHRAARFAMRHGLPFAYVGALSDMVRASIIADTGANVEQFTLYPKTWGPIGGWMAIKWDGSIFTVRPVKRYAMLAANATNTAVRLYVSGDHSWLAEGAAVTIGANDVAGVAKTVTRSGVEIGSDGQRDYWIEINTTVGSALNTSAYALVLQYDEDAEEASDTLATCQELIDYLAGESEHTWAVKHANFSNAMPANVAAFTPIKELAATWNTVTNGTCPATVNADLTDFIADMNGGAWEAFSVAQQVLPHTYLLVNSNSTVHGTMRDYAAAERARGYPIAVVTGCGWGDVVLGAGDSTDPKFRAASLNSQDVMLAAGGLDREAACISLAAAVFGRRVRGGPAHNLTNDELIFSELETKWDEINSGELSALGTKGVVTYKHSVGQTIRYRISQGLSTLQANAVIWNPSDATTWSVMQRDLADFVSRVVQTDFEELVIGSDKITTAGVAQLLQRRARKSLEAQGYIKPNGFTINSIVLNDAGNGYDVTWSVRLPDTVDFVTVTTNILIGE